MEESKKYFGVALLYWFISTLFFALSSYSIFFPIFDNTTRYAVLFHTLFKILLCVVLYLITKKQGYSFSQAYNDGSVRKTAGAAIVATSTVSLAAYLLSIIYTIQHIEAQPLSMSILTIISYIIMLGALFVGLYLMKSKKSKGEVSHAYVSGSVYLFFVLISAFSLVDKTINAALLRSPLKIGFYIWLAASAVVIAVLFFSSKKHGVSLVSAFRNEAARKTAGILLLTDGIFDLPQTITSIYGSFTFFDTMGYYFQLVVRYFLPVALDIIIIAAKIVLGAKMMKDTGSVQVAEKTE